MAQDDTRSRLLQAAIEAIDAGGEAAVSVDAIAKAANVSAPTIYNHFRNREALVAAAQAMRFDRLLDEDFAELTEAVANVSSPEEFAAITDLVFDFMLDPARSAWRMNRISVLGSALGRPELAEIVSTKFVQVAVRFAGAMQPLQERGLIRQDLDLAAFAAWFIGSVTGRLFIELRPTPIDSEAWNRIFRESVLAVALPPAPA